MFILRCGYLCVVSSIFSLSAYCLIYLHGCRDAFGSTALLVVIDFGVIIRFLYLLIDWCMELVVSGFLVYT